MAPHAWLLRILVIGAALMLFACGQEGGQSTDLSKKGTPNFGAISSVDGSGEEKEDARKPKAGLEQKPEPNPAGSQPASDAKKQ